MVDMEVTLTRRSQPAAEKKEVKARPFESLIAATQFLPPAFELIPRLLLLLDDPEADSEELAQLIRTDPGLTANVLRIANSACLGGVRRTESAAEAISRIGLREVYRALMQVITSPALKGQEVFGMQRVDLWRHSLATAVAAETLARHLTDEDHEVAFTAGLLHDLGKALFSRTGARDYSQLLQFCAMRNDPVCEVEREAFGVDHAAIGAELLRAWKFPDRIAAAVAAHHAPLEAADGDERLASLVYAGNILAYRLGEGNGYPVYAIEADAAALELINMRPETLRDYEEEVRVLLRRERERLK